MARDVKDIGEMRALVANGENLEDVVFHYKCPDCGKRKKITLRYDGDVGAKMFVGDKTRLDSVLAANGRCVRCSINAGELEYKQYGGGDDDEPYDLDDDE
jgi:hypothetical protein